MAVPPREPANEDEAQAAVDRIRQVIRRANTIQNIYDAAAPLPDAVMTTPSVAFLAAL